LDAPQEYLPVEHSLDLTTGDLEALRELVESQSPRSLGKYLDYRKRLRSGTGLGELGQWLGKILLDDGSVYDQADRSLAFEIAVCERIRGMWKGLEAIVPEMVTIVGPVNKLSIYRRLLDPHTDAPRCAALLGLLEERYKKTWLWLRECALEPPKAEYDDEGGQRPLLDRFLQALSVIDPIDEGGVPSQQLEQLHEAVRLQTAKVKAQEEELEVAEDRAARAHLRAKTFEVESKPAQRQLREERENGEKLRQERTRRIKIERESRDSINELQRLRSEYIKLDERLRDMARRAAAAEAGRGGGGGGGIAIKIDLSPLRSLAAAHLLGLGGQLTADDLNRARRQFASALHSDRVSQLPSWVVELFDELMGIVNETCDRAVKP